MRAPVMLLVTAAAAGALALAEKVEKHYRRKFLRESRRAENFSVDDIADLVAQKQEQLAREEEERRAKVAEASRRQKAKAGATDLMTSAARRVGLGSVEGA